MLFLFSISIHISAHSLYRLVRVQQDGGQNLSVLNFAPIITLVNIRFTIWYMWVVGPPAPSRIKHVERLGRSAARSVSAMGPRLGCFSFDFC